MRFAPKPRPTPAHCAEPSIIEMVPMRDGVCLYTEIFLPVTPLGVRQTAGADASSVPRPVLLMRTAYPISLLSRQESTRVYRYGEAGYVLVCQLTRGQGLSEGDFRRYVDDPADGYDCIEWIAKQPWCDGAVGMFGGSYVAGTQLMAAREKPPSLKCIMPTAFTGSHVRGYSFCFGVPRRMQVLQWLQLVDLEDFDEQDVSYGDVNIVNHPIWGPALTSEPMIDAAEGLQWSQDKKEMYREIISHPMDDDYYKSVHFTDEELFELDIPIFFTGGWYDTACVWPLDFFARMESAEQSRSDRYLLIGPWNHGQSQTTCKPGAVDGNRVLPENGVIDQFALRMAFFDRYLKGDQKSKIQQDRVRVFITGANEWRVYPTYPVPDTAHKKLYLHSGGDARSFPGDGRLDCDAPTTEETPDAYVYDPMVPTNSQLNSYTDRRHVEVRSDVLTYTSAPLKASITILGEIVLNLSAASDAPDTDWFAVLTEVFPDGRSMPFYVAPPAFRARYREGMDREVFMSPGVPYLFRIPIGSAGHNVAKGNRLRLSIFSSAFPEFEPNRNTGNEAATDTDTRVAKQLVFHDRERASCVDVPVVR